MAFNFNWSPLAADATFYQRARDLLTTALNKTPKPPIIVDDIIVTEFNLGSVPPDLEILEIGDIAADRFRGIFKMCYAGDAFLTLKTRVQANPLNTYLSSKPTFTSPTPLAAASGLTIPLQITLSEIKLSAFIIVVFSKQKGLTLVFRNDPLESLKVSSTFDSIQFVRDYLQRTIEGKLRDLMMDELPAIIHRLSLQLWSPDEVPKNSSESPAAEEDASTELLINPLADAPTDAVDAFGNIIDTGDTSSFSAPGSMEAQSLFSQKNLLRLAALTNSHRTLSLFTPGIREVVFRAWARPSDRQESAVAGGGNSPPFATPSLARCNSYTAAATSTTATTTTYTFSDTGSQDHGHLPARPSMVSLGAATTGLSLGAGSRHPKSGRKKKTRVVNLRKSKTDASSAPVSEAGDSASDSVSVQGHLSEPILPASIPEEREQEEEAELAAASVAVSAASEPFASLDATLAAVAAAAAANNRTHFQQNNAIAEATSASTGEAAVAAAVAAVTASRPTSAPASAPASGTTTPTPVTMNAAMATMAPDMANLPFRLQQRRSGAAGPTAPGILESATASWPTRGSRSRSSREKDRAAAAAQAALAAQAAQSAKTPGRSSVNVDQAWIMKMASEIARRVYDENRQNPNFWVDRDDAPPPAYEATR